MTDKRQKATKFKCKREESLAKQSIFVEIIYSSLEEAFEFLLELIGRSAQHFAKIDQKTCKIGQICVWNLMTTGFIM